MANHAETVSCALCHKKRLSTHGLHAEMIHAPVLELMQKKYPDIQMTDFICQSCVNKYRSGYVQEVLEEERGELSTLEQQVIDSLKEQDVLTKNINDEFDQQRTWGEKVADGIANFAGSWAFIIIFIAILIAWIILNGTEYLFRAFDPFPFILLNLLLSCIAALQAPVILMSQNRQAKRDRLQADNDYGVNLKAELEVRHLNWKMDKLLSHQWQRLLDIQRIQTELMEEVLKKTKSGNVKISRKPKSVTLQANKLS